MKVVRGPFCCPPPRLQLRSDKYSEDLGRAVGSYGVYKEGPGVGLPNPEHLEIREQEAQLTHW